MIESSYVETNNQYHSGAALDDYGNKISIVAANIGNDDKLYLKWVYPQNKERKPSDKTLPVKVDLGDVGTAISILEGWILELRKEHTTEQPEPTNPEPKSPTNNKPKTDDEVPF